MTTNISIAGKISAILNKKYEGKETTYLQFITESETKGFEIIKVKITNQDDLGKLEKGAVVSIPIVITTANNALYYTQSDSMKIYKEQKQ
jgi:hypothetical protein